MGLFDKFKKEPKVDLNKRNFTYLEYIINTSEKEVILDSDITLDDNEASKFKKGIKKGMVIKNPKNIIIDGKGHFIDAKKTTTFFTIMGKRNNIHFKNICFKNGGMKDHYAILFTRSSSKFEFTNCIFENNFPLFSFRESEVILKNCSFINNKEIFIAGSLRTPTIYNVDNCSFKNNKDVFRSGFNVSNCIFEKNENVISIPQISAGTLENYAGTLEKCEFRDNNGTIFNSGKLRISECIFNNNHSSIDGGVIHNRRGSCYINNSKFIGNSTSGAGGAILNYFLGSCQVHNSCFKNNKAETSGGGAIFNMRRYKTAYDGMMNTKVGGGILILGENNEFHGNTCSAEDGQQVENSVADFVNDVFF